MHSTPSPVTAGLNGAVLGAAAAGLLGLMLTVTALLTGGHVNLPGLIEATGGTTNGAASVEFTLGWTALAAAAVIGASFEARRTRSRTHGA
ncbi:hypothetical protein E7Z53_17230 [Kocuria salina]|uniref:hypothetical protein n=1 Tax=Kocuria salina TaxID=1929416 RepID=UPI001593ACAE|nr:hypothetical protein [Kocuria salina]NVC25168.1 hypothetical protein [Kocuria salina]